MVGIALGVLAEQGFRGNVKAVLHKQKKRPNFSVALFGGEYGSRTRGADAPQWGYIYNPPKPSFDKEGFRGHGPEYPYIYKKTTDTPKGIRRFCGEYGSRTRDLLHAMQAL